MRLSICDFRSSGLILGGNLLEPRPVDHEFAGQVHQVVEPINSPPASDSDCFADRDFQPAVSDRGYILIWFCRRFGFHLRWGLGFTAAASRGAASAGKETASVLNGSLEPAGERSLEPIHLVAAGKSPDPVHGLSQMYPSANSIDSTPSTSASRAKVRMIGLGFASTISNDTRPFEVIGHLPDIRPGPYSPNRVSRKTVHDQMRLQIDQLQTAAEMDGSSGVARIDQIRQVTRRDSDEPDEAPD